MSSILKALKKVEREKSVPKPYSFRIDAEILRGGTTNRPFYKGASLAAIALFLCGVGATYLYMKHDKAPEPAQTSQAAVNRVKSESSNGSALLPVSDTTSADAKPEKVLSVPEKLKHYPRSMEKRQDQKVKPAETVPHSVATEVKPVSLSVPVTPAAAVHPARPALKVNGIAFQDGSDSVAVINGTAVSIGSVIEGARVEEIQKDRVKFSRGGEKFDIILDKSN